MTDPVSLVLSLAAGLALGVLFFGGLWWTVGTAVTSRRPALWFMGSMVVRMSAALAGFYLIGRGRWDRLVVCLLGFLVGRFVVTYVTRRSRESRTGSVKEAGHAAQC